MAKIFRENENLKLQLSTWEKIGGLHLDLVMPILDIKTVELVSNPWDRNIMRGMRAPGTGWPYVIMLGTLRNFRGWKAFCAIYRKRPAVVITFNSGKFDCWIITIGNENFENLKLSLNYINDDSKENDPEKHS